MIWKNAHDTVLREKNRIQKIYMAYKYYVEKICGYIYYVCGCSVASVISDSETSWTVALQALLSMGFSRQEYW